MFSGNLAISKRYQSIVAPLLILLIVTLLSVTFGRSMVERTISIYSDIGKLNKETEALAAKKDFLQGLKQGNLYEQTQMAVLALPGEDSLLPAVSTIRTLAFDSKLQVVDIKSGGSGGEKGDLRGVGYELEVQGALVDVVSFLGLVKKVAPLTRVVKIEMTGDGSSYTTELGLKSYWALLPKELLPVESPVEDLDSSEKEVLKQLEGLQVSQGVVVSPIPAEGRSNPFVD